MRAVLPFRTGLHPASAHVPTPPSRVDNRGAELEILVLAADARGCVGVDLDSGAFVRASYGGLDHPSLLHDGPVAAFDVVAGRIGDADAPDVSRPETVVLRAPPRRIGEMSPRRAERYLAALHHPRRNPVLGFAGRSVPYWTLTGDRPSLTLLDPVVNPQLRRTTTGYECRFTWQGTRHQYPLGDRRLTAELEQVGWPKYSARDLAAFLDHRVRCLLIVLTPPHDGYCHKVVAALLPGG